MHIAFGEALKFMESYLKNSRKERIQIYNKFSFGEDVIVAVAQVL